MNLVTIHSRLSTSILLYVIILCIWGFWRYIRKDRLAGNYWGALAIAELLIIAQGLLGGVLLYMGVQPDHGGMHILYGIVGTMGIPAVYIFTKGRNDRYIALVYSTSLFLIAVIFIRSIVTG